MSTIYEINMSNAQADVNTGRVKQNSKIVEVFSALSAGKRPEVDDKRDHPIFCVNLQGGV